jgi:hypothetical protein
MRIVMQGFQYVPIRAALRLALFCVIGVSCSGGIRGVPVKGKVVKDGRQPQLQEGDTLVLYFVSTEEGRRVRSMAIYRPADGTFECNGPTRQGVPTGKLKVEMYPSKADLPPYVDYLFKGEFKGEKTPLEFTLTEANSLSLVIDVGKKAVLTE